jgi:hypothetical protein
MDTNLFDIAGRAIGVLAGGVAAALWVAIIWFPVAGFMLEGIDVVVGGFMALFSLVAAIAAFHGQARVIFVCFVACFFGVGAFALNVDHWFRVFGVLDLMLLAASAMIWISTRRDEEVE